MPRFHSRLQMRKSEWKRKSVVFWKRLKHIRWKIVSRVSILGEILRSFRDQLGPMWILYTLHIHVHTLYFKCHVFIQDYKCQKAFNNFSQGAIASETKRRLGTCMGIAFVAFVWLLCLLLINPGPASNWTSHDWHGWHMWMHPKT